VQRSESENGDVPGAVHCGERPDDIVEEINIALSLLR